MSMLVPSEKVTMTMLMFSEEVEVSSSMPDTVAQADLDRPCDKLLHLFGAGPGIGGVDNGHGEVDIGQQRQREVGKAQQPEDDHNDKDEKGCDLVLDAKFHNFPQRQPSTMRTGAPSAR